MLPVMIDFIVISADLRLYVLDVLVKRGTEMSAVPQLVGSGGLGGYKIDSKE